MRSRLPRRLLPLAIAGSLTASMAVAAAAPPAAGSQQPGGPRSRGGTDGHGQPGGRRAAGAVDHREPAGHAARSRRPARHGLITPASPATAARKAILTMSQPGQLSQVHAYALSYLDRGLDPALFSVAALRRAERGGQLPVRVSYRGRVSSLPGVKIVHAAAGTAYGYLTARRRCGSARPCNQ